METQLLIYVELKGVGRKAQADRDEMILFYASFSLWREWKTHFSIKSSALCIRAADRVSLHLSLSPKLSLHFKWRSANKTRIERQNSYTSVKTSTTLTTQ